jgi:enoyl-CoA hydratase
MNRPARLNALSYELLRDTALALAGLDADKAIRALILTGGVKIFAAGADIREMAEARSNDDIQRRREFRDRVRELHKPIIAAVSGYALGGGLELALNCDLIVAGESARFGHPEINLGLMPGNGGTQLLPRAIGKQRAMEMILLGEPITATRAYELGLVNKVVPDDLVLDEARTIGAKIAAKPDLAVRRAKAAVRKAMTAPLDEGLDFERRAFDLLLDSADCREGIRAFIEKRTPKFKRP